MRNANNNDDLNDIDIQFNDKQESSQVDIDINIGPKSSSQLTDLNSIYKSPFDSDNIPLADKLFGKAPAQANNQVKKGIGYTTGTGKSWDIDGYLKEKETRN